MLQTINTFFVFDNYKAIFHLKKKFINVKE